MAIMAWSDGGATVSKCTFAMASSCVLSGLPRDVLDAIIECLVGWDLLQLSSVNRVFHRELLADAALWAAHLTQPQQEWQRLKLSLKDAKAQYASLKSFRFNGQTADAMRRGDRGPCIEALRFLPTSSQRNGQLFVPLAPQRFAFDVWFSLSGNKHDETVFIGGVILGAQSVRWQDTMVWADYHQQFVHADEQRKLYCSVVGDPREVASDLELNRWYHLAYIFDGDHERLYLDGEFVRRVDGMLHRDWRSLYFMQIGTGCISAGSVGAPHSSKTSGWYPFNGMIDEFRVWEEPLSDKDIKALASDFEINKAPAGSLRKCDKTTHLGAVEQVSCSRPRERASVAWP